MREWSEPGLEIEAEMAMHWWADMPDVTVRAVVPDNAATLRALSTLQDTLPEIEEEHSGRELAQLSARLDLLLDLVAELHFRLQAQSHPRALRLSAIGASWSEEGPEGAPAVGEAIQVELFLEARVPKAVVLPATVLSLEGEGPVEVRVRWRDLGLAESDELERWVFRRHRQERARQRSRVTAE